MKRGAEICKDCFYRDCPSKEWPCKFCRPIKHYSEERTYFCRRKEEGKED